MGLLTPAQVRIASLAAAAGPALPGTRSWWVEGTPAGLFLHSDPSAWSAAADATGRHARIAGGAALLNVRVAVRGVGITAVVQLMPSATGSDVLGKVLARDRSPSTRTDLALAHQQMVVHGGQLHSRPVDQPVRSALRRATRTEGGWLGSIRPSLQRRFDEISVTTAVPNQLVVVLCTLGDTSLAQLQAGLSLQNMLLTAMSLGLRPEVDTKLIDAPAVRWQLRELLGGALWPQVIVRLDGFRADQRAAGTSEGAALPGSR